jgi:hypothetical protein
MNVAKPLQCLLNLKKANLFTVVHAFRNAAQRNEDGPNRTLVLTQKTLGQGETAVLEEKKRKNQLAFSKNTNVKT